MDKAILKAEVRKISGRKVKNLRKAGLIPANIYGKKIKSESIEVDAKEFAKVYAEARETGLVEIKIGTTSRPVLIHNTQRHPVTEETIHVDFLQVDLKEKVEAEVPVELSGESPAEKQALGTVVQYINEVMVEALPGDLPEKFTVDISNLAEVDQAVFVKDLKIDKSKIEVKEDLEAIVVKVEPPQKEEVIPVAAETPAGEEVTPEGEIPTEGEVPTGKEDSLDQSA